MRKIIVKVRKELKNNIDFKFKKGANKFFKEPIKVYGVRSNIVRKIALKYFPEAKTLNKKQFFLLSEEMLKSDYHEEAEIVFIWTEKLVCNFSISDFNIFEKWLNKYANNWAKVDTLCPHAINYFVQNYPKVIPRIKQWTSSKNRWMRRAAAVSFLSGSRDFPKKKHLRDIFWIAKKLLKDPDDLVQKGYGWMLKCAAENYEKDVFNFVMKHKKEMPRTALRYAIEKMPKRMKIEAME
jgi:3-methyladenine DNA glycosylase AlkD